jgi:hypothetical protein
MVFPMAGCAMLRPNVLNVSECDLKPVLLEEAEVMMINRQALEAIDFNNALYEQCL